MRRNLMNLVNFPAMQKSSYGFWLFAIATVLIFVGLGFREPWPADEPRFAEIAKEMVETGQWFFPARAGEYYPDKPPVFMWSIALFYMVFGSLKVAFLLPSALCSLLTLGLVYDMSNRLWGKKEAWVSASLLLFSFQFLLQAKSAQIDAMVCCWITLGCYGLLRFLLIDQQWRWYYLAFFFMGIGVITKGVGFLPLFMLVPYFFVKSIGKRIGETQTSLGRWGAGPLIMLLAISLWFVPMLMLVHNSQDPALIAYSDNILFKQTVTRYADAWHHIKPFWYYLVEVIPVFWLPISLALPWLLPHWYRAVKRGDGRIVLPLGWIVLVLLFFSLSPGKRGVYILPALPMLALISAPYFSAIINKKVFNWLLWGVVFTLSMGFLGVGLSGLFAFPFTINLEQKFGVSPWLFCTIMGLLIGGVAVVTARNKPWRCWPFFISIFWALYATWGYSLLDEVKTPKQIYANIQKKLGQHKATIALVDFSEQFILFSPYPIVHFGYHTSSEAQLLAAYQWLSRAGKNKYLLVDQRLVNEACFDLTQQIPVGYAHRKNWLLLPANALKSTCLDNTTNAVMYRYPHK